MHRKSYSEVVRDMGKYNQKMGVLEDKKDVVINCKNVNILNTKYDNNKFNFKINLVDQQKHASSKSFGPKLTTNKQNAKLQSDLAAMERKKKDSAAKGFKKYSQGYTINKLAKEPGSKVDSYVKVINKSKNKSKRPNSSKKRKPGTSDTKRNSSNPSGHNKLTGNSIGLYNGNFGDRNS